MKHSIAAERMREIQPFHVMALLAEARQREAAGQDIIHMEVGEPDFPTPAPIVAAGIQALQSGQTKYTPACGLPALREAIAAYYACRFGVTIAPQRIIVTPGASGALQLVLGALLNPRDEVLMTDPGYPCNRHFVRLFEGKPVAIPVGAETAYQLNNAHIQAHWGENTRAVMLASPANPTGTLLTVPQLADIYRAVRQRGGELIVDEIYQGLTYGVPDTTALAVDADNIWVINSFSKYFGMTGWRLGWVVAPEWAVSTLDRLAQNIFLAASTPAQYAALAAFTPEALAIMEAQRQELQQRRDFLLPALRELGFSVLTEPQGAFYIYAGSERFGDDAQRLCANLLDKTGVVFTPGIDFGSHQATTHVRFAYTTPVARLAQAVERLERGLRGENG
ncbi:pyridoxal phosphate-dependent aminotransferase [Thiothrix subterranea]|uniref:Aminotransferase n=1 Tax=Thiothrix subterranea TaxID=2735563 RepID=A0AA51MMB0_9GAMM|nr:pyridoxal phosphate-dependent aminotransferase [Thiothrix subterranea]MDQ5769844.1 pyridoxal phosphate-dependent aminotransferase [Thiothrix subterranea]WML84947.1 pyridoxal phosphate-dependent aminotransferase [Thiothrix subterranea]